MKKNEEFCILPNNPPYWLNYRASGYHRHEIFFGTANRKKSIEDGLVIFLKPEMHNMGKQGIHFNRAFDLYAKRAGERAWLDYYGKTVEDFIHRYGRNYL